MFHNDATRVIFPRRDRPQKNTIVVLAGGMCGGHCPVFCGDTQQRQIFGYIPLFHALYCEKIYVGATASKAMRNSMVIITTLIFLPAYYLLEPFLGNNGLWLAMLLFMGARGVFLSVMVKKALAYGVAR